MKRFVALLFAVIMTVLLSVNIFAAAPVDEASVNATNWATFDSGDDYEIYGTSPANATDFVTTMSIFAGIREANFSSGVRWVNDPKMQGIKSAVKLTFEAKYNRKTHYTLGVESAEVKKYFNFPSYGTPLSTYTFVSGKMIPTTSPDDSFGFNGWNSFTATSYYYMNIEPNATLGNGNWHNFSQVSATYSEVQKAF